MADPDGAPGGRYRNETLERTFRILEVLNDANRGLSVSEVGRLAGLHRATVHRFLINLAELGYARRDPDSGDYWIGFNLARFGLKSRIIERIVHAARPAMRRLSAAAGCMSALGSLEGSQVQFCDIVAPPEAPDFPYHTGDYVNAAATAMGRALLALRPDAEVLRVCRINPSASAAAAANADVLLRRVREARAQGYAATDEEATQRGFRGLAAPLLNPAGRATCAIALIGTSWQLPPARDQARAEALLREAQAVVAALTPGLGRQAAKAPRRSAAPA
jgi:DNA-binding IclR family transcriptional regulator